MAIQVALHHRTRYRYDRRVSLAPHIVRLRPAPHCRTPILAYSLKVLPANHFINWQQDPQSNYLARLVFPEPTTELFVEVDLVAKMAVYNPFDFFLEAYAEQCPFSYDPLAARELRPFLETEPAGPKLAALLARVPRAAARTMDFLVGLNQLVQHEIGYVIRMEPGVQTCEETLTLRSGSCRDSAWLLVQIMRHLGLAARFVSGYLIQLVADVKPLEGPAGPTADFTDLHAWTEAYLPGAGWVGFDPTSGLLAGEGHIPLACTPDASSAAPISGLLDPCNTEFTHEMTVERIYESPRVTKPYTAQQWHAIEKLGHQVDADLRSGDVRLTMGGEPTFVSLDDAGAGETPTRRGTAGQAAPAFRARRPAAFRTGEVVSRRAAAALGIRLPLAQGWRSHLGGCQPHRRGRQKLPLHCGARAAIPGSPHAPSPGGHCFHHRSIRGRLLLSVEGTQAAGQRRSA
jgi:transglutaminase-like putative cysteine protease